MGNNDPSLIVMDVGGKLIREHGGLTGWKPKKDASFIEGPGGVAHGFNLQSGANGVEFDIRVYDTSPDLGYLHGLSNTQERIQILVYVPDDKLGSYEVGQEVGLGAASCLVLPGERGKGAGDAEYVVFHVMGIGPITREKPSS